MAFAADSRVILSFQKGAREIPPGARVSVIVCTYNRPQMLPGFLRSLFAQASPAGALIIVDASPGMETEKLVSDFPAPDKARTSIRYFRVSPVLKGLTLQRNFGLKQVSTPLVAYFDDDVVLKPDCLAELVKAFDRDPSLVGAAGYNDAYKPSRHLWEFRKRFGVVSDLRPGSYQRSGMSVPWSFMSPDEVLVSDWLPGCGMMWKTDVLNEAGGFNEGFSNYALGEDLDMSLRAGKKGKLVVVGPARFDHLLDKGGGRPDSFRQGYMEIHNRYIIQRRCLNDRTFRDVLRFTYAWGVDTLMLLRRLTSPKSAAEVIKLICGRFAGVMDLIRGK